MGLFWERFELILQNNWHCVGWLTVHVFHKLSYCISVMMSEYYDHYHRWEPLAEFHFYIDENEDLYDDNYFYCLCSRAFIRFVPKVLNRKIYLIGYHKINTSYIVWIPHTYLLHFVFLGENILVFATLRYPKLHEISYIVFSKKIYTKYT